MLKIDTNILDLNVIVLILAILVIITKLFALWIRQKSLKVSNYTLMLSNQPYFTPLLIVLNFVFEFLLVKHSFSLNEYFGLQLSTFLINILLIIRLILVIVLVLQEERNFFSLLSPKREHPNFLQTILPAMRSSIRLSIIALLLPSLVSEYYSSVTGAYFIDKFTKIFIIVAIAWLFIQFLDGFELILTRRYGELSVENFSARSSSTKIKILKNLMRIIIIILAIAATFMLFDSIKNVGASILASAGLATVILGFAAKKTFGGWLSGIQIVLSEPIRINDLVFVQNEFGTVEEINLTYVVVRTWDLRRLILPIEYFLEQPFVNFSRNSTTILSQIFFYADYSLPVAEVRQHYLEILKQSPMWDGNTAVFQVMEATERTIKIRALASVKNPGDSWNLKCEVLEKIIAFINDKYPNCIPKFRVWENQEAN